MKKGRIHDESDNDESSDDSEDECKKKKEKERRVEGTIQPKTTLKLLKKKSKD